MIVHAVSRGWLTKPLLGFRVVYRSSADPLAEGRPITDPIKAERRRNNQLDKEIRTLRQQLNRFCEITASSPHGSNRASAGSRSSRSAWRCESA